MFAECSNLTDVTLGNGIAEIGASAFYNCNSLESIVIPNGVTTIGNSAFQSCDSLKNITIPEKVETIGMNAFRSCTSLTSVSIPESVKTVTMWAFKDCSSLTNVSIPGSDISIGNNAFQNDPLTTVVYGGTSEQYEKLTSAPAVKSEGKVYTTSENPKATAMISSETVSFATASDGTDDGGAIGLITTITPNGAAVGGATWMVKGKKFTRALGTEIGGETVVALVISGISNVDSMPTVSVAE